jgi:hypothetical protein
VKGIELDGSELEFEGYADTIPLPPVPVAPPTFACAVIPA